MTTPEAHGTIELRLRRDERDPGENHAAGAVGTLADVRKILQQRLEDWKPPAGTYGLVIGKVRISHGTTEWLLDAQGGDCAEVARALVLKLCAWDVSSTVN